MTFTVTNYGSYYIWVVPKNSDNTLLVEKRSQCTCTVTDQGYPEKPSNLSATADSKNVTVTWYGNKNNGSYTVFYSINSEFPDDPYTIPSVFPEGDSNTVTFTVANYGIYYIWVVPSSADGTLLTDQKTVCTFNVDSGITPFDFSSLKVSVKGAKASDAWDGEITLTDFQGTTENGIQYHLQFTDIDTGQVATNGPLTSSSFTIGTLKVGSYKIELQKERISDSVKGNWEELPGNPYTVGVFLNPPDISSKNVSHQDQIWESSTPGSITVTGLATGYDSGVDSIKLALTESDATPTQVNDSIQISSGQTTYDYNFENLDTGSYYIWVKNSNAEGDSVWIKVQDDAVIVGSDAFDGLGTEASPFIIRTVDDMRKMGQNTDSGKHFRLVNNIDYGNSDWQIIGSSETKTFTGHFNGNGFVLSNVKINGSQYDDLGVFFPLSNATITGLGFKNIFISSVDAGAAGIVACKMNNSTVSECFVQNSSVSGNSYLAGGIVGQMEGGSTVKNCYVYDTSVSASRLLSDNSDTLAGGITAFIKGGNNLIDSCYVADSYINTTHSAPECPDREKGSVGGIFARVLDNADTTTVRNSLIIGDGNVFSYKTYGYCIGNAAGSTLTGNHAYVTDTYTASSSGYNGISCNASNFTDKTQEPLKSWDFSSVWIIDNTLNRPVLRAFQK